MNLTIQSVLVNVTELEQSLAFYQEVFDLHVVSRADRVVALMVNEGGRTQVLILREMGRTAYHAGRGTIGVRMVSFEVASIDELDRIERRLADRDALAWRGQREERYRAVVGLDPDRIEVSVSSSLTGAPIRCEDWTRLDDTIYAIE
jgi:catechol-2,3-dioxygenase